MFLNPMVKNFFNEKKENLDLFTEYLITKDKSILYVLEKEFSAYYKKVIVISYFSKSIYYISRRFDKNINQYIQRNIFDETLLKKEVSFAGDSVSGKLESIISNADLYDIIEGLSEEGKEILVLLFIEGLSLKEIGLKLGVSPQAVHKKKVKIFKEIRNRLNYWG